MTAGCSAASGTCQVCSAGCRNRPGWFAPGEAEAAAALSGLAMGEFFTRFLSVNYWAFSPGIYGLSPAVKGDIPGQEHRPWPGGRCVFFTDAGECSIHAAKPAECADFWCGQGGPVPREQYVHQWAGHQDIIRELLGRDPDPWFPDRRAALLAEGI